MKSITTTSTKAEILKAYNELLETLEDEQSQNSKLKKERDDGRKLFDEVKKNVGQQELPLQKMRENINQQLDAFQHQLSAEKAKFENLCTAIENAKNELEVLHQVKGQAESLEALLQLQKQKKLEFDTAMTRQQQLWEQEKEAIEYNTNIQRRNDEDAYKQQKVKQEKELKAQKEEFEAIKAKQMAEFSEKEAEYNELKSKASTFDAQLKKIAEDTEKQTTSRLTQEMDFQRQLANKDFETDIKLLKLEIESLKAKVKDQTEEIQRLTTKADGATSQVKEIAIKAIENKGKVFFSDNKGEG